MTVYIGDVTKNGNGEYQATAIGLQSGESIYTIGDATRIGCQNATCVFDTAMVDDDKNKQNT